MTGILARLPVSTPLDRYIEDVVNANLTYIGRTKTANASKASPVWQIIRILKVGTETEEEAAANRRFDQVWDDRASLFPDPPYINEFSLGYVNTNKRIDVADSASINFTRLSPWSWSFWLNSQDTGAWTLVNKQLASRGYSIEKLANESFEIEFRGPGGVGDRIVVTSPILASVINGNWHHILITYAGLGVAAGMKMYYDSVSQLMTVNNNTLVGDPTNTAVLSIGSNSGGGNNYVGMLDEPALWNVELDAANVVGLYNAGVPTDPRVNLGGYTQAGNLVSYWPFTQADRVALPVIADNFGVNNGNAVNIVAGNFITETAP